jgi:hypothetical protein
MARARRRAPGAQVGIRTMSQAELLRLAAAVRDLERRDQPGCPDSTQDRFRPLESPVRAYVRAHRAPVTAAVLIGGADLATIAAHAASWPYGYAGIAAASVAAGSRVAWKHRKKAQRRPRARRYAYSVWGAGSAAALIGTAAGVASGPGQAVMLAGGLAAASPYLWHARKRAPALQPAEAQLPVLDGTDPRIARFTDRFCSAGPCKGAVVHAARGIPDGFAFELALAEDGEATTKDVIALGPKIAALYDLPADQVTVEYTPTRSERRARISVLTTRDALDREDRWDGTSTYADSADAHWLLHKPRSGAASGVIAGMQGHGKTGSIHVIACEAGMARLCSVCGPARSCARCDPRPFVALLMGDPQEQPFGVWRGHAHLTAWGPQACVHMILMMYVGMKARAAHFGSMTWTDHLGRANTGKGWYDASPQHPLLMGIVDEWPLIIADPELRKIVLPLAAAVVKEGRKVGVSLTLATQMPDLTELGVRSLRELLKAFNTLSHRTDGLSKSMLGVQGDTSKLPYGVHGLGYLNGPDQRSRAVLRTKTLPDYLQPGETGLDVREIAGWIAANPVTLDEPVRAAWAQLGYTGPGQVLDSDLFSAALAARALGKAITAPGPAQPAPAVPQSTVSPPFSAPVPLQMLAATLAQRGEMDLWDVSDAAGVDAFEADRALRELATAGLAVQTGPTRYRASSN